MPKPEPRNPGLRKIENQRGATSETHWKFTQAVASNVRMTASDTVEFDIEARGTTRPVVGSSIGTADIIDGAIGDFSGTFPPDDADNPALVLGKFSINDGPIEGES